MRFLTILVDSIAEFIRRNPILCISLLMLALLAPSLLKGIAAFILYFILGMVLFGVVVLALLRWKLYRMQRDIKEQFSQQQHYQQHYQQRSGGYGGRASSGASQPGEVKVHMTADAPEKRISDDIGDYVEFEETKNEK